LRRMAVDSQHHIFAQTHTHTHHRTREKTNAVSGSFVLRNQ
jgi:hypothetical protein